MAIRLIRRSALFSFLILLATASTALAQGLLVDVRPGHRVRLPRPIIVHPHPRPTPESTYKIKELDVRVKLADQVARVQVSQSFVNTGSRQMEVCFVFPLPYDGAVDRLTLMVDGKEYPAKLLPADEARKIYESIVSKNRDPALLEWMGTGMFKTSVFPVPPGQERKVSLRYSQVCRKLDGLTDFVFPLSTAKYTSQPVEKFSFHVAIESSADIKNIYSPSHSISVERPDDRHATITYQRENTVPQSDFRLFYDVGKGHVGASVVSYRPDKNEDGFFLLLASPKIVAADAERPKKTVVLIVDRSGSMSGKKIEQAKDALKFVLNNLREGDLFNVIAYDSEVDSFRDELQRYNDDTRQAALGFVEGINAGGSTNIDSALAAAMGQLVDSSRPSYLVFLTDGRPTAGETNEAKIVVNAKKANQVRARLFSFGVGFDVNSRLLDKLVRANHGQSEYVLPDEDIENSVSRLYNRIGAPVMTDLAIKFDLEGLTTADGEPVNRVYPRETMDLFAGEQLVIVGRYRKPGDAKVVISGLVGGEEQKFDFPAKLAGHSADAKNAFVEKLWATRRVGEILDELDLKGRNEELVKELVTLATKHGILTPYTSFLADESSNFGEVAGNVRRTAENLSRGIGKAEGGAAFGARAQKGLYQRAMSPNELADGAGRAGAVQSLSLGIQSEEERQRRGEAVQQIGRKTFFHRGDRWVDSAVSEADEKNAKAVRQFSPEFFDLVRRGGPEIAKYLSADGRRVVTLEGEIFAIEPAE